MFSGLTSEYGSQWKPSFLEEPVEELCSEGKNSESLPDVLREDRQDGNIGLQSCPSKAEPLPPENLILLVPELSLVDSTRGQAEQSTLPAGDLARPGSHWSSSCITALSLVETFTVMKDFHSDATPAHLIHKEPAQGTSEMHPKHENKF